MIYYNSLSLAYFAIAATSMVTSAVPLVASGGSTERSQSSLELQRAENISGTDGVQRVQASENSNICVSMRVDQNLWPVPLAENSDQRFSNAFSSRLATTHANAGGQLTFGKGDIEPRFISDHNREDPRCRDVHDDILISLEYSGRNDGTVFVSRYLIQQDGVEVSSQDDRNIAEELRNGTLQRYQNVDPVQRAIIDDIDNKAIIILDIIGF